MIVKFTTGNHFSPNVQCQVDIYRNRNQMKNDKPIYRGLEPLGLSARNAADKVRFEEQEKVTIIFNGYLPSNARTIVTTPFKRRKITINPRSEI